MAGKYIGTSILTGYYKFINNLNVFVINISHWHLANVQAETKMKTYWTLLVHEPFL